MTVETDVNYEKSKRYILLGVNKPKNIMIFSCLLLKLMYIVY